MSRKIWKPKIKSEQEPKCKSDGRDSIVNKFSVSVQNAVINCRNIEDMLEDFKCPYMQKCIHFVEVRKKSMKFNKRPVSNNIRASCVENQLTVRDVYLMRIKVYIKSVLNNIKQYFTSFWYVSYRFYLHFRPL